MQAARRRWIVQELESTFRAAGWQVIKVMWGGGWDALLERDQSGLLRQRMMECVDGDYQTFKSQSGAYVREHFFGKYPQLLQLVADMTDKEIWALTRGGHDPEKVYAAYAQASNHSGQPTVILAKTVKGFGMGDNLRDERWLLHLVLAGGHWRAGVYPYHQCAGGRDTGDLDRVLATRVGRSGICSPPAVAAVAELRPPGD